VGGHNRGTSRHWSLDSQTVEGLNEEKLNPVILQGTKQGSKRKRNEKDQEEEMEEEEERKKRKMKLQP